MSALPAKTFLTPAERPRRSRSLDLVAIPSAITVARMFISLTLRRWQVLTCEEDAKAIVGAVVEAIVLDSHVDENWFHTQDLVLLTVTLHAYERTVVIEVRDTMTDPGRPPLHNPQLKPSGLDVVQALSTNCGSSTAQRGGHLTWAELDTYERTAAGLPRRQVNGPAHQENTARSPEKPGHDLNLDLLRRIRSALEHNYAAQRHGAAARMNNGHTD